MNKTVMTSAVSQYASVMETPHVGPLFVMDKQSTEFIKENLDFASVSFTAVERENFEFEIRCVEPRKHALCTIVKLELRKTFVKGENEVVLYFRIAQIDGEPRSAMRYYLVNDVLTTNEPSVIVLGKYSKYGAADIASFAALKEEFVGTGFYINRVEKNDVQS